MDVDGADSSGVDKSNTGIADPAEVDGADELGTDLVNAAKANKADKPSIEIKNPVKVDGANKSCTDTADPAEIDEVDKPDTGPAAKNLRQSSAKRQVAARAFFFCFCKVVCFFFSSLKSENSDFLAIS